MFAKWFILLSAALALSVGEGGGSGASNAGMVNPNLPVKGKTGGDPVGYADGAVYDVVTDVRVSCPDIDLVFRRSYGSWSQECGSIGLGWTHSYDWKVVTNSVKAYVFSAGETGVNDGVHVFPNPPPCGSATGLPQSAARSATP